MSPPSQTLFFSATFPPDVQKIAQLFLLPTHQNISTISEFEKATHEHVPQSYQVVTIDQLYPATAALLSRWLKEDQNCKVILFANTAVGAGVFGEMVSNIYHLFSRDSHMFYASLSSLPPSTLNSIPLSSPPTLVSLNPDVPVRLKISKNPNLESSSQAMSLRGALISPTSPMFFKLGFRVAWNNVR
jgi:hypothetical protein